MIGPAEPGDPAPSGLDEETIDRILGGRFSPQDAPPGYGQVVELIQMAQAGLEPEDWFWEPDLIGPLAAAVIATPAGVGRTRQGTAHRQTNRLRRPRPVRRVAAATGFAILVLSGGTTAAAATGTLPPQIRVAVTRAAGALHLPVHAVRNKVTDVSPKESTPPSSPAQPTPGG